MKKIFIIIGIIIIIIVIALGIRFLFGGDEDTWICKNGEWVEHGNPSAPKPTEPCGEADQSAIIVTSPQPNQAVTSLIALQGKAKGMWFFEANFPVRLLDNERNEIATSYAYTIEDWMTENFVSFNGKIEFKVDKEIDGILVFEKANPSGLPENAEKFEVPVRLIPEKETMVVKVYFNNSAMDPEFSCNKVFPVDRKIPKTDAVARAALEELFKGPTDNEKNESFFTSINQGVKIQKLVIENKVAKVDFSEQLEFQVGGSCRVAAIRAQITETLKQFSTVNEVVISINGRTEDILQP